MPDHKNGAATARVALLVVALVASASSARAQDLIESATRIAPPPAVLPAPRPPTLAHVFLLANRTGITYSVQRAEVHGIELGGRGITRRRFTRLCTAPCEVTVNPGVATLMLEASGGGAQTIGAVAFGAGDTTLVAHYESRAALRIALWVVGTGLLAGGLGTFIGCLSEANDPAMAAGLAITSVILSVLGIIVAALVEAAHDDAGVRTEGNAPLAT